MNYLKKYILGLLLIFPTLLFGQTAIEGNTNTWFLLLNRFKISEKWSITNELHERTGSFLKDQAQFIVRPSVDYQVAKNVEVSVGYSFLHSWSYYPYFISTQRNEHNLWEQVLIKADAGKFHFQNRYRQENRWVDKINAGNRIEGSDYSNRFRYRLTVSYDLCKLKSEKSMFIAAFDELWINQDARLKPSDFTRNWLFLGVGLNFNQHCNLQIGYMNQYDKVGIGYINSSIIQTVFVKNFDLSKK